MGKKKNGTCNGWSFGDEICFEAIRICFNYRRSIDSQFRSNAIAVVKIGHPMTSSASGNHDAAFFRLSVCKADQIRPPFKLNEKQITTAISCPNELPKPICKMEMSKEEGTKKWMWNLVCERGGGRARRAGWCKAIAMTGISRKIQGKLFRNSNKV